MLLVFTFLYALGIKRRLQNDIDELGSASDYLFRGSTG
jgi:hypothetical protein